MLYWLSHRATSFPLIFPIAKWVLFPPSLLLLWLKPTIKASIDWLEKVKLPTLPLRRILLVSPTLHTLAASPASLAALIAAQVLEFRVSLKRFTVTLHVLLEGAVWFVPSATLTVIVAEP